MKLTVKILLLASLGFNVFFIWKVLKIRNTRLQHELVSGGEVNKTTWSKGFESFITKLKEKDKTLSAKKYYYINVWTTWCAPCIKEMPWLDSLAGTLNKDVGYFFISDISEELAKSALNRKNYNLKNFIFLNDMNDFVSGICNERGTKNKAYPMALIVDLDGNIFYSSTGAYEYPKEVKELADIINKLP